MRIAFFGGTFDPPHRGHMIIARVAKERLELDRVLFAPVATQPLKGGSGHSSFSDRMAMVRLAVAHDKGFVASDLDAPLPDGQPNFTFDTLQKLRSQMRPADNLFCLLGADSFLTLNLWHRSAELLLLCDFIVAGRPGFALEQLNASLPKGVRTTGENRESLFTRFSLSDPSGKTTSLFLLPDLDQDISATEIRTALAEGQEPQTVLDPAVAQFIRSHGLYR